jgi:hypothetical protein
MAILHLFKEPSPGQRFAIADGSGLATSAATWKRKGREPGFNEHGQTFLGMEGLQAATASQ